MSSSKYAVFLKVTELGSMSKAAMHCNYSQSAVSQIISSLEDELQMTLLNRSQSGVTLTASGEQAMMPVSTQCCCGMRSILAFWTHRLPRDSTLF